MLSTDRHDRKHYLPTVKSRANLHIAFTRRITAEFAFLHIFRENAKED